MDSKFLFGIDNDYKSTLKNGLESGLENVSESFKTDEEVKVIKNIDEEVEFVKSQNQTMKQQVIIDFKV